MNHFYSTRKANIIMNTGFTKPCFGVFKISFKTMTFHRPYRYMNGWVDGSFIK